MSRSHPTALRRLRNAPIRTKLTLAITPLIGLIAAFIYLYFPAALEAQALAALADRAQRIGEMTAYSAAPAVFFNDPEALDEALEVAQQNDDLIYLMVVDARGEVLSAFRPRRAMEADYQRVADNPISEDGLLFRARAPIMEGESRVGEVYLGFSLERLHAEVRRTRNAVFWISLVLFLAGGVTAAWISAVITKPLRAITRTVERIAQGDLSQRAEVDTADEVGQLARSFNAMVQDLAQSYRAQEALNADLTRQQAELIEAKEAAEEMVKLKSAFLANMSHEIRTPLSGMIGFAQILAEEVDDDLREFTALIEESGNRLLQTLSGVLDYARLEANELRLAPRLCNLSKQTPSVVRLLEPLAQRKGLPLRVRVHTPHAWARVDEYAFGQIVTNLVGNALKFTEQGEVEVAIEGDAQQVYLHVRDTGIGIDEAFLPRIFEEFQQESTGASRSHEGTGLGLSITRRLVDLMHGTIRVSSLRGQGSLFTVAFPRADVRAMQQESFAPSPLIDGAAEPPGAA